MLSTAVTDAIAEIHELLERGRRTPLSATPTLTPERAEELVAELRATRSRS